MLLHLIGRSEESPARYLLYVLRYARAKPGESSPCGQIGFRVLLWDDARLHNELYSAISSRLVLSINFPFFLFYISHHFLPSLFSSCCFLLFLHSSAVSFHVSLASLLASLPSWLPSSPEPPLAQFSEH